MKLNINSNHQTANVHERAGSKEHRLFVFPDSYIIDCGTRPRFAELDLIGLRKTFHTVADEFDNSVPGFTCPICDTAAELVLDRFEAGETAYAQF